MGSKAKKNGQAWESELEMQCRILRGAGRCDVRKVPDPVQITGREGGRVHGFPKRREWNDFYGVLKGGMACAFEAKSTEETSRYPLAALRARKDGDPSQLELLQNVAAMGGVAFVALRHVPDWYGGDDYLLPISADGRIAEIDITTLASLEIDGLGRYQLKPLQNWLDKLAELRIEDNKRAAAAKERAK